MAPEQFVEWRNHVDKRLDRQDQTLNGISGKLDGHIQTTAQLTAKVTPVVEKMESMDKGIRVIGWLGTTVAKIAAGLLAVLGAITAWHNWK